MSRWILSYLPRKGKRRSLSGGGNRRRDTRKKTRKEKPSKPPPNLGTLCLGVRKGRRKCHSSPA
jgi:hypothetical protein